MHLFAPTYVPKLSATKQPAMSGLSQPAMGPSIRLGKVTPTHFGELGRLRSPIDKPLNHPTVTPSTRRPPELPRDKAPRIDPRLKAAVLSVREPLWR